jgi:Domain of unknown function (DUF4270)
VKNRQLALTLGLIITCTVILFSSCKKINEATELGGDLIPPVDNIHTFDTTVTVEAYNDLFTLSNIDPLKTDSVYSHYTDEQFLGVINTDPLFGKTDAQMFFELKPTNYPFTFKNKPSLDSLFLDSVVLILDYVETYGDSSVAQMVDVSEITSDFRVDTAYLVRKNTDITVSGLSLGSTTFIPKTLDDSVKAYQDTTSHQLRIKLNTAFGNRLLLYDTAGVNNAYSSDSLFKTKFKGFALKSTSGGKAVMGFDLQGTNTKLAIYYRYLHGLGTDRDTTVDYFYFKPGATYGLAGSASHNYINRDYSGSPLLAAQGGASPDPFVYIQNTPGSFAKIKMPDLGLVNNRVVHRAELIAEQVYDVSDTIFPPPSFLYLDAYDPALAKYRNIPYDVVYDGTNGAYNLSTFGAVPVNALDASGKVVKTWHFNITRYIQHVVTGTEPVYDLRLFAPLYAADQYFLPIAGATAVELPPVVFVNPSMVKGRVRLAGGTAGPQRMRLRIVFSKL